MMRAKMRVDSVTKPEGSSQENLHMRPVCKTGGYPEDGSDENNSFARWTPAGSLELCITNPNLHGKFAVGDEFYVDFTKAE